jgi:predicted dehydrogenase
VGGPMKIGIVGVGKISEQYLESLPSLPGLQLVAVADRDPWRAAEIADAHNVRAASVAELLADREIEAILNLTTPESHIDIDTQSLNAGKHVFAEKPLGLSVAESAGLLELATSKGLRIGSAPDTVLGTGIQTARNTLTSGRIGDPVGAAAFWHSPGHELWHPNPAFYYQPGAGPLFDMGPYYLTTLVTLLGPVARVWGHASRSSREREVATGPKEGEKLPVNLDTHIVAVLEHASGVASSVTVSFEVWASRNQRIEIYGTAGTIAVPDPNKFSEPVEVWTTTDEDWVDVPVSAGYADAGRGYGLADMAHAIRTDRPHRASAEVAFHVLEVMESILAAGESGAGVEVRSSFVIPEPVPLGATPNSW